MDLKGRNFLTLKDFTKEEIERAVSACGFPVGIRGEALTLQNFADLANCLSEM